MLLVKLGGSLLTDKGGDFLRPFAENERDLIYGVNSGSIAAAGSVLRDACSQGLILVHGGGTHGHRTVARWRTGVVKGGDAEMAWEVKWRMGQLTERVLYHLGKCGIHAVEVSPSDLLDVSGGRIVGMDATSIARILERGSVPLLRGDLVAEIGGGWSVVSGDDLLVELSRLSRDGVLPCVEEVFILMKEEGFRETGGREMGKVVPLITSDSFHLNWSRWRMELEGVVSGSNDVTGGVAGKLLTSHRISSLGLPVRLLGGNIGQNLKRAMIGEDVGTRFDPFSGGEGCNSGTCVIDGKRGD